MTKVRLTCAISILPCHSCWNKINGIFTNNGPIPSVFHSMESIRLRSYERMHCTGSTKEFLLQSKVKASRCSFHSSRSDPNLPKLPQYPAAKRRKRVSIVRCDDTCHRAVISALNLFTIKQSMDFVPLPLVAFFMVK